MGIKFLMNVPHEQAAALCTGSRSLYEIHFGSTFFVEFDFSRRLCDIGPFNQSGNFHSASAACYSYGCYAGKMLQVFGATSVHCFR